jgi:capsular exopolysaccharide synthesis family protein
VLTHGPTLEAYRAISTTLSVVAERESMRALTLVSADEIDHNSAIAANVAMESAESGTSTMVVDADLRSPRLSRALGISVQQSLSSFLDGTEGPEELIHKQDVGNDKSLFVVPQGRAVADPTPLLTTPKFRSLVQRLRDRFSLVLIEAPALSEGSDGLVLCDVADGVVLVVQVGTTRRDHLERARQQLSLLGTPVVGVIINESAVNDAALAHANA